MQVLLNLENQCKGSMVMKKWIAFTLILLLCPTISFAGPHRPSPRSGNGPYGHHYPPPRHWDGPSGRYYPPPYRGGGGPGYYPYNSYHHHDSDWIAPLAIFGAALGIMALSQSYAPPPPPQRICRDAYHHYDQYGRYLYTEYVDRPCN